MAKIRVIPVLLLKQMGLEKSIRFRDHVYIGSPINAARVFNGRNVDELILLDIAATPAKRPPNPEIVAQIAEETQMPLTVGGGIRSAADVRNLLNAGVDRVSINSAAFEDRDLIRGAAELFGSQCIVASIDVKKNWRGKYEVCSHGGRQKRGVGPVEWAQQVEGDGAGEILLTSIDRDGTLAGYDVDLIRQVSDAVSIPVIACGGAGHVDHFAQAVDQGGASAVAAGAFFLFFGPRRTVLITYPGDRELVQALGADRVRIKDPEYRAPIRTI